MTTDVWTTTRRVSTSSVRATHGLTVKFVTPGPPGSFDHDPIVVRRHTAHGAERHLNEQPGRDAAHLRGSTQV